MIWMILTIGLVGGGAVAIGLWIINRITGGDQIVDPTQMGGFYKKFREDLDIDRPHPDSYRE